MTTEHHPSDVELAAFAAGTLDEAQSYAIATHVRGCASCRAFVRAMEHVGGIVLDGLPPTSVAGGSSAARWSSSTAYTNLPRAVIFLSPNGVNTFCDGNDVFCDKNKKDNDNNND